MELEEQQTEITILVVDDIEGYRQRLSAVIEQHGYTTITAGNGAQAIQLAIQQRPDVIIMDVHMPEMDGFTAARALRRRPETDQIPLIFLTAEGTDPASMARGISLGAYDYLKKPADETDLMNRLRAALRSRDLGY